MAEIMAWTGKRTNVIYNKPEEPSFLKKFKEKVGYKDGPNIEEKFKPLPAATAEDLQDGDDELPQVVQLKPGDLTQDEYEKLKSEGLEKAATTADENDDLTSDGRIKFRKPAVEKRRQEDMKKSAKKKKTDRKEKSETSRDEDKKKDKKLEQANKKLLSFDDENDET